MDSSISTLPCNTTTPDVRQDQLLPLPTPSTDRLTQLAPLSSDSLLLTFPAHARQVELHVRNREPRCWTCTVDRKRCTIEMHEPDQAPCRRCQNLGHSCSNDPKERERRKLTLSKCDGCRERKQKCEFDEPWPEKCRLCKMHDRPCSEPRVVARGRARLKADTTTHSPPPPATYSPPAPLESHTSHISSTVAAPKFSNSANSNPTPPSSLNAVSAATTQYSPPPTPGPSSPGHSFAETIQSEHGVGGYLTLDFSTQHPPPMFRPSSLGRGSVYNSTVEFTQLQHEQPAPLLPSNKFDTPLAYLSADPPQLSGSAAGAYDPSAGSTKCKYCGGSFKSLARHIQDVHRKIQKLDCPEDGCQRKGSRGFTRQDNLRVHLRHVHDKTIPKLSRRKKREVGSV